MFTYWIRDFMGAARARQQVRALAETLGAEDSAAVEQVAAELACNCVEHRSEPRAARLRCYREGQQLVVETLNRCADPPSWLSPKAGPGAFREGGRGLVLARALAARFSCFWERRHGVGFVGARAEFPLRPGAAAARGAERPARRGAHGPSSPWLERAGEEGSWPAASH